MTNNQAQRVSDEQIAEALAKCWYPSDQPGNSLLERVYPGDVIKVVKSLLAPSIEADTASQPAQGEQAVNTLHEAIMNLPRDNRQSDEFKRGHRDARHAAAELVAQTQPPQQDSTPAQGAEGFLKSTLYFFAESIRDACGEAADEWWRLHVVEDTAPFLASDEIRKVSLEDEVAGLLKAITPIAQQDSPADHIVEVNNMIKVAQQDSAAMPSDALFAAVQNLIKVKGRHNTETAYQRLLVAFDIAASQPTKGEAP